MKTNPQLENVTHAHREKSTFSSPVKVTSVPHTVETLTVLLMSLQAERIKDGRSSDDLTGRRRKRHTGEGRHVDLLLCFNSRC